jgi:DNA-binding MurR/RpiR family transcriptional regulator
MTNRGEAETPKNFSELRSMIATKSVIFPDQVKSVVRKALAEPELIAFGSTYSVAAACSVSQTTVVRLAGLLGFASFGELRTLFREHLCDRIRAGNGPRLEMR